MKMKIGWVLFCTGVFGVVLTGWALDSPAWELVLFLLLMNLLMASIGYRMADLKSLEEERLAELEEEEQEEIAHEFRMRNRDRTYTTWIQVSRIMP